MNKKGKITKRKHRKRKNRLKQRRQKDEGSLSKIIRYIGWIRGELAIELKSEFEKYQEEHRFDFTYTPVLFHGMGTEALVRIALSASKRRSAALTRIVEYLQSKIIRNDRSKSGAFVNILDKYGRCGSAGMIANDRLALVGVLTSEEHKEFEQDVSMTSLENRGCKILSYPTDNAEKIIIEIYTRYDKEFIFGILDYKWHGYLQEVFSRPSIVLENVCLGRK